jgi:hypothetical protein
LKLDETEKEREREERRAGGERHYIQYGVREDDAAVMVPSKCPLILLVR